MSRVLGLALVLGLAAGPAVEAQPPGKPWRVAGLGNALPRSSIAYQTFEQRLRELGYHEGRNLVIDFRTASRVAVLRNSANPFHREVLAATHPAAATQKIELQLLDVQAAADLPKALDTIGRQRADSLLVLPDAVSLANRKPILEFAASRRLPAMYPFREMVDDGGLLCYGPNLADSFRTAAEYVDRILKGARPGDLPIAQPTRFDFVVNLKTARALGLTIPQSILVRADDVIR
jgi:ABC-type uncharacterized transport system substrate-binding protein